MWVYLRLLAASSIVWLPGSPAAAWTHAHVVEADVDVALAADGRTHVVVELLLDVEGGWVEGLELPGWDAVVALDDGLPATVTTADGRTLQPQTALNPRGAISLQFQRRAAPRKGEHHLRFGYFAESALSAHADGLRMGFTLPGWEAGLRRATVNLHAPMGTQAVVDPDVAVTPRSHAENDGARILFERVHVPRNTPWTVLADVPGSASVHTRAADDDTRAPRDVGLGVGIAAFVLGMGHAARWLRRRRVMPPVPGRTPLPRGVAELAAIVGACWWPYSLAAALLSWLSASVALALLPGARDSRRMPFGRLTNVPRAALAAAERAVRRERWGTSAPCDATTVLGLLALAFLLLVPAACSGAFARDGAAWGLGLLCVVPAFFAGTRLENTNDRARQLVQVADLAASFSACGWGLRLAWLDTAQGPSAPRLVCTPALRMTGVWNVSIVPAARRPHPPILRLELDPALAEQVLHSWASARRADSAGVRGRRVLDLSCEDADRMLTWLADTAALRSQTVARSFATRSLSARSPASPQAA